MRKIWFTLLMLLGIVSLASCGYDAPTADVTAVVLGDTEKQVIEKAGKPLFYFGAEDIFIYDCVIDQQYKQKVVWFRDGKVSMLGELSDGYAFTVTQIAETHDFVDLEKLIVLWHDGMDMYETVGFLGTEYELVTEGKYNSEHIYAMSSGELRLQFYGTQLTKVIHTIADGGQEVLWEENLPIWQVKLGDTKKEVKKKVGYSEEFFGTRDGVWFYEIRDGLPEEYKVIWFDEKNTVYMMADLKGDTFENWEVAEKHKFLTREEAKQASVWASDMSFYDVIGLLGPKFTLEQIGGGITIHVITYTYESGESLIFGCSFGMLSEVTYKDADGTETVLWDEAHSVKKKDGTPVL